MLAELDKVSSPLWAGSLNTVATSAGAGPHVAKFGREWTNVWAEILVCNCTPSVGPVETLVRAPSLPEIGSGTVAFGPGAVASPSGTGWGFSFG